MDGERTAAGQGIGAVAGDAARPSGSAHWNASKAGLKPPTTTWGDRPEHFTLVQQHVDVADRLPAVGDHHGQVDEDSAAVMDREHPGLANATDEASVSPARSANIRSSAAPTCDTTCVPSR